MLGYVQKAFLGQFRLDGSLRECWLLRPLRPGLSSTLVLKPNEDDVNAQAQTFRQRLTKLQAWVAVDAEHPL